MTIRCRRVKLYTHAEGTLQALLENIVSCLLPAVSRITSKNSFRVSIATRIAKAFNVTISFLWREKWDASVKFINDFATLQKGVEPVNYPKDGATGEIGSATFLERLRETFALFSH